MTAVTNASGQSENETTIRIVFDGAPLAGKTTAAYSLGEALGGTTATPSEQDGRTLWFDWMTYTGGRHDGKAIRVELVTVPGQAELADRRRYLVAWADVVVFVADTTEAEFDATVAKYEELQQDLKADAKVAQTVIIANKRDRDDALPIDVVTDRLGLEESAVLVEGVATNGAGLRQAFIFAVRAALTANVNRPDVTSVEELLAEMSQLLGDDESAEMSVDACADDDARPDPPEDVAESESVEPMYTAMVRDARLVRDALGERQTRVLMHDHWQVVMSLATGQTSLPFVEGSAESQTVTEMLAWGLVAGEVQRVERPHTMTHPEPDTEATPTMTDPEPDTEATPTMTDPEPDTEATPTMADPEPIDIVAAVPQVDTPATTAAPASTAVDRRNERYRALRELRRSLVRR